jgi:hypothetical protein
MSETTVKTGRSVVVLLLVWLFCGVYTGSNLKRGWVPHDEGTLGQAAERVLHGEMPHRDFTDPYTGGLSYLDALLFGLFGINLFWLRLFLFAFFLAWVPAVYAIARQFLVPWTAGGVTLVAVVWSVPNYSAAMPSWFCLFFATFGTLALTKYIRRPAIHWLVLAGLCGGFSFLIKSVALYYIAAVLLFFVYREQSLSRNGLAPPRRTPTYLGFLSLCLVVFVFGLIKLVMTIGGIPEFLHFVLPGLAIALLLAVREHSGPTVSNWSRFKSLFGMVAPFLLASALPVILFFIFYWHRNALAALMNGLFVAPMLRVLNARREPPNLILEYPSVLAALFLVEVASLRDKVGRFLSAFLVVFAALVLLSSRNLTVSYIIALYSAQGIVPVLAVAAVLVLYSKRKNSEYGSESDQQLVLLLIMTFLFNLIQFPFASSIYFCYGAPLAALSAAALLSRLKRPPRIVLCTAVAFYALFAVFVFRPSFLYAMGSHYQPDKEIVPLTFPRTGHLRVSGNDATQYEALIPFVKERAGQRSILAGPDCPEIYFLSGLNNPTPVLFDFLQDPHEYEQSLASIMDRPNFISVAVVNEHPEFSYYQLTIFRSLVKPRFPESRRIGAFTVYWRP